MKDNTMGPIAEKSGVGFHANGRFFLLNPFLGGLT